MAAATPMRERAPEEEILAWIHELNEKAVKLTDNKPQVFEIGPQGTVLIADANTFLNISQFEQISELKPGIWAARWMDEENEYGSIIHWQFQWLQPGPLDLDNLPTSEVGPHPILEPLTEWEDIAHFSVDSGKMSVFDKDMMEQFIEVTGDERLVIDVCQDPFSDRMGYQGVLPGGFFTGVHDGGYRIQGRRHDGRIVHLKVRQNAQDDEGEQDEGDA